MGLFGNPNRKAEKIINDLQKKGYSSEAYKKRKSCSSCTYYTSLGNCNLKNKRTIPAEFCNDYWGK